MDSVKEEAVFEPLTDSRFFFSCHRDIACFTRCCARLRLVLTPYDILRIKCRLGLSSDRFLADYTETLMDSSSRFPLVKLRMNRDAEGACPFVSMEGCAIYEDRPEACRLYPIGRASAMADGATQAMEKFFVVAESHCLGFSEKKAWTLEEWLDHEGVREYAAMSDPWRGIVTSAKPLGPPGHLEKKHQMFFMASYNLDRFREFLFGSRFFELFDVDTLLRHQLKTDDVVLMRFACDWLRFSLFGEQTLQMKG